MRAVLEPAKEIQVLDRLAAILYTLVDKYFNGDPALKNYIAKRIEGAREVLAKKWRIRLVRGLGPSSYRAVIASSKYVEARPPRKILVKTLTGGVVEVEEGTPVEQLVHFTEVSPWMLRCTCPDAVYTASKADTIAMKLRLTRAPVFHRYSLCKHTLALLAKLAAEGRLSLENPWLRKTLVKALLAAYIKLHNTAPPKLQRILAQEEPTPLVN